MKKAFRFFFFSEGFVYRVFFFLMREGNFPYLLVTLRARFSAGDAEEKLRNAAAAGIDGDKRRPRRAGRADDSLYRAARQAGLRGLANKFSITAAQLGEVLSGKTRNDGGGDLACVARKPVEGCVDWAEDVLGFFWRAGPYDGVGRCFWGRMFCAASLVL